MPSKKVLIGIVAAILIVVVISVVAFFPVILYGGFQVNTAEVDMDLQVSDGTASLSSADIKSSTSSTWNGSISGVKVNERVMNVYEYLLSKADGLAEVSDQGTDVSIFVDIQISFNLTTPSNRSLIFEFNPKNLKGEGLKELKVLLGPDELNSETGTFHLRIIISVFIDLPDPLSDIDINLTPVDLDFTVNAA
jgi:hypothetical protein